MSQVVTYRKVLQYLAAGASLREVLEELTLTAQRFRPHMLCSVLLLDESGEHLLRGAAPDLPEFYNDAINGLAIGATAGSCGAAAFLAERVIAADVMQHPNWAPYRELAAKAGLRACWSQPILSSAAKVLGTFAMYYREPREPDSEDIEFIDTSAQLAGVAIELKHSEGALVKARDELERRVEERTRALESVNGELEDKRRLLQTLIDLLPSRIFVKDTDSRFLLSNRAHQERLGASTSEGVVGQDLFSFLSPERATQSRADDERVMTSNEPLLNREVRDVGPDGATRWFLTTKVPWHGRRGQLRGLVGVSHDITKRKLAEEELERVAAELRAKNQEMEADLAMAREIQHACLPHQYPHFPSSAPAEDSQLRFFHRYRPTTTLAGDFFDVFPLSEKSAGVFICDVMGHGVRASLVTTLVRGLMVERMQVAEDPAAFLMELNRGLWSILRQPGSVIFVTASYLVIDLEAREVRAANAGHPSPLHVHRKAQVVDLIHTNQRRHDPALGVIESFKYSSWTQPLSEGDLLLLYTDGIFQRTADGRTFDQDDLIQAISGRMHLPPDEVLDGLLDRVSEYSGDGEFSDDVCLVGVELAP